jgi:hypothetical protein
MDRLSKGACWFLPPPTRNRSASLLANELSSLRKARTWNRRSLYLRLYAWPCLPACGEAGHAAHSGGAANNVCGRRHPGARVVSARNQRGCWSQRNETAFTFQSSPVAGQRQGARTARPHEPPRCIVGSPANIRWGLGLGIHARAKWQRVRLIQGQPRAQTQADPSAWSFGQRPTAGRPRT